MRFTGIVILAYLIWHLADFTWGWVNPDFVRGDVYRNVQASLTNAVPAAIYVLATIALGVHLYHGSWSLFQSLGLRSEEHTSELQSLMRISYAVFCLKKKNNRTSINYTQTHTKKDIAR